jgi:uncharacterized membrane protein YbhN (UPF0104 family)
VSELSAQSAEAKTSQVGFQRAFLVLRFAVPVAALAYLLSKVPIRDVLHSASSMSWHAVVSALAVLVFATCIGTLRWRVLFSACGITSPPPFLEMLRAYFIAAFYATCVPGGLGGEVVRAMATRRVVGPRGLPASLAIVFLDRTCGLTGMLILVAGGFSLYPLKGVPNVLPWSAFGICVAAAAVLAIVSGPRLAPHLPGPLGKIAAALPTIESLPLFAAALGLSVITQLSCVVFGHILLASITSRASFTDSLVILPLVGASQYFPLTVGGAGVREAGFVVLFATVGVSKADALAASLVNGALTYVTSGMGGVLHLLKPVTLELTAEAPPPATSAPSSVSQT